MLQKQPFVYSYYLYGVEELKNRPARGRIKKNNLSELLPSIQFVLVDKGAFYQFQMQVWVNGKKLSGYDAGINIVYPASANPVSAAFIKGCCYCRMDTPEKQDDTERMNKQLTEADKKLQSWKNVISMRKLTKIYFS